MARWSPDPHPARNAGAALLRRLTGWSVAAIVLGVAGASYAVAQLIPARHPAATAVVAPAVRGGGTEDGGAIGSDPGGQVAPAAPGAPPAAISGAS